MIYTSDATRPTENVPTSRPNAPPLCSTTATFSRWRAGPAPSRLTTAGDGHGVGQGRRHRRTVHRSGAAGNGAIAPGSERVFDLSDQVEGKKTRRRAGHRRGRGRRARLPDRQPARHRPVRRWGHPGDAHDRPGLGADHEARGRHHHRSRWPHLARRHRQPRTRSRRRGRDRQRDRGSPQPTRSNRVLRRGR